MRDRLQIVRRTAGRMLRAAGLLAPIPVAETREGLFLHHQKLLDGRNMAAEPGEILAGDELRFRVAHAFESSVEDRRRSYAGIAALTRSGDRALDIGCGDGTFLELLRSRGATAIGIDLDPEKVEACQRKGFDAHCIRVQDIETVLSEKLDFVSLIHIIEHLEPAEALEILTAVRDRLTDRGRVVLVTPNIAHPGVQTNFWLDITHVRPYPQALLNAIVRALGFPCWQSGLMSYATETWCYGFRDPRDAIQGLPGFATSSGLAAAPAAAGSG